MREILNMTNSISVHEIGRFSTTIILANNIEIKINKFVINIYILKNSSAKSANFVHRLLLADIRKQIIASHINKFKLTSV